MNLLTDPGPLAQLRAKLKLSKEDIAEHTGLAPVTIASVESGKISPPTAYLYALSDYSTIPVEELQEQHESWVYNYRRLPHAPHIVTAPVGTKRDQDYQSKFIHYMKSIRDNAEASPTFRDFIEDTFSSRAAACRILKLPPSTFDRPASLPTKFVEALETAGYGYVISILNERFFTIPKGGISK